MRVSGSGRSWEKKRSHAKRILVNILPERGRNKGVWGVSGGSHLREQKSGVNLTRKGGEVLEEDGCCRREQCF